MSPDEDLFAREGDEPTVRWFVASYDSLCGCGGMLLEGERGGYIGNDDEASCESCVLAATS
jgi:hypothetical protein